MNDLNFTKKTNILLYFSELISQVLYQKPLFEEGITNKDLKVLKITNDIYGFETEETLCLMSKDLKSLNDKEDTLDKIKEVLSAYKIILNNQDKRDEEIDY